MKSVLTSAAVMFLTAGVLALAADDLTPSHVQAIFSARGANPGAVFQADGKRYVLRSMSVESGGHHGEFVVRIRVDSLAN